LGALLVIAFIVLSVMAGGPKDILYMVRYALRFAAHASREPESGRRCA